jgi:beta-1,4-N-acetylglucosaminyltransferase
MRALLHSFYIIAYNRPELIICNGPGIQIFSSMIIDKLIINLLKCIIPAGTCVPLCYAAFIYRVLGIYSPTLVFVESFCRVKKLSLTGILLYYIADRFVVHWPQLLVKYSRAEYIGQLV